MLSRFMLQSIEKSMPDQTIMEKLKIKPKVPEPIVVNEGGLEKDDEQPSANEGIKKLLPDTDLQMKFVDYRVQEAQNALRTHTCSTLAIDFMGLIINILTIPVGIYAFVYMLAQRLDQENEISFFIILIPLWISALPVFAYIIINGLAASNTRVNKCEKISLSFIIPLGFLITLILLVSYIEGHELFQKLTPADSEEQQPAEEPKWLKVIFVPHLISLICLYLYLRCLVRPARVQTTPSQPSKAQQRNQ